MKKLTLVLILSFFSVMTFGQDLSSDFKTIQVNKKIKEFRDTLDLSSPLKSCASIYYLMINGQDRLWGKVSTTKYKFIMPDSLTPDSKVDENIKSRFLETSIKEVVYYKDSIACVISEIRESKYSERSFQLENGKWVSAGEDPGNSLENVRQHFAKYADQYLHDLRKILSFSISPTDTASFITYLKNNSSDPKEFVLDKLKKNELVMYGEIHRRKWSWDFCKALINDKRFIGSTGVIFLELASNDQNNIDQFLSNDSIDKELLLNIFRNYMVPGWNDKGKFDFLISVWSLNRELPANKKIRIIFVDTPRIQSEEGMKNDTINRDVFMANEIAKYMKSNSDKRNALFIVGSGHICKTTMSAGSILTKQMPGNSYTIFTHCPRVDNFKIVHERIRHGMFDYAFYKNGDKPMAFELKGSPFGKEPFDGLYFDGSGRFQDNYDGYIFFGSLDNEPCGENLIEMYDDKFVLEMDRRYKLFNGSFLKDWDLDELSSKAVINKILSEQTKTRWEKYVKPLKDGITIQ